MISIFNVLHCISVTNKILSDIIIGSADSSGEEDSDEDDETMKGQPDAHDLVSSVTQYSAIFISFSFFCRRHIVVVYYYVKR